ncbi:sensor histidine kinase [Flavivirga jejuensis]|uniref:Histidine kinase n=1 Tax=Flavivirga jejuensis TaxID=870487 RepID=A0ABT8WSE2_9FLAO|nr:histidine kinase [Flavivirga jejuensis]MDO5976084.1 histidine kinase [Flavivirga jejuensis]
MILKAVFFFKKNYEEIIFQIIVSISLFLFYSYNQGVSLYNEPGTGKIIPYELSFFCNYMVAAMLINYVLLPKIYSKKRFTLFFVALVLLISIVILIDEFVLEKIYFPDTRGVYFPGILFTLIETLPTIVVFVGFKFAWDYNKKQSEIETLKTLVQESELQFLKSQINPHFLFNNLNNLYAYAIEKSPKTPSIILELASVLRYMLYDCKEDYVSLSKEIMHLKNFTALYKLQIEHRGDIQFNSGVKTPHFTIAPLILMVFIENAFKHSTASQSENIVIHINIDVSEVGELHFTCKNGFSPIANTNNLSKGIGLINVKKRLHLLYPNAHDLKITDSNNIFNVELILQLKPIETC